MHRTQVALFLGVIVCVLIAALIYFTWLQKPSAGESAGRPQSVAPSRTVSLGIKDTITIEPKVREVISAFERLLENIKKSDSVDFGATAKGFSESGFGTLKSEQMLQVLDIVDFGNPESETVQGSAFLLESATEALRDQASDADVVSVARRLRQSSSEEETWKWLKTLDLMSVEGNQGAYISILNDLPEGEPDEKLKDEAEMLGRVLGQIGSEQAVAALLSAAADPRTAKQVAVDSSIGYVQDQRAIKPIADLIDGPAEKAESQLAAAVGMLGYIPSEYSVMSLRNLSSDPNEEIAAMANQSLKLLMSNNPGLKSVTNP